jgi:hypothetical protein
MNVLQYILSLKPAVPMSNEKPCSHASNSEVRRWINDGSVLINYYRWTPEEELDCPVVSLVFFPKGKRRTTLV